ncbi:hypothetical protein [Humibacter antri]
MSSKDWDRLRLPVCAAAENRCEVCGRRGRSVNGRTLRPHCHEVWVFETRNGRNIQRLERLIALCQACHSVQHMGRAAARGKTEHTIRTLQRVNGWTRDQALADIHRAIARFETMDHIQFDLDLGALAGKLSLPGYPELYIPAADRSELGNSYYGDDGSQQPAAARAAGQVDDSGQSPPRPKEPDPGSGFPDPQFTPDDNARGTQPSTSQPGQGPQVPSTRSTRVGMSAQRREGFAKNAGWVCIGLGWLGFVASLMAIGSPWIDVASRTGRFWLLFPLGAVTVLATVFAGVPVVHPVGRTVWFIAAGMPALALLWALVQSSSFLGNVMKPIHLAMLVLLPIGSWLCAGAGWVRRHRQAAEFWGWMVQRGVIGPERLIYLAHSASGPTESLVLSQDLFTGIRRNEKLWGHQPAGCWVLVTPQREVTAVALDTWRQSYDRRNGRRT